LVDKKLAVAKFTHIFG